MLFILLNWLSPSLINFYWFFESFLREYILFRDVEHCGISSLKRNQSHRLQNRFYQVRPIPYDSGIKYALRCCHCYTLSLHPIPECDSVMRLPVSHRCGIRPNRTEFQGIPELNMHYLIFIATSYHFIRFWSPMTGIRRIQASQPYYFPDFFLI